MNTYNESWFENKTKEEVIKQISELRKNIKRKHRTLKQNILEGEEMLEKTFKPIADPLKQLVEEVGIVNNEETVEPVDTKKSKRKLEFNNEEDDLVTPVKRHILNPSQGVKRKKRINARHKVNYNSDSESDEGDNILNQPQKRLAVPPEVVNIDMEEPLPEGSEMDIQGEEEQQMTPQVVAPERDYVSEMSGEALIRTPQGKALAKNYIDSNFKGRLSREYFSKLISGSKTIDHNFGVRVDGDKWKIGDKELEIDVDDLIVGDRKYKGTRGLYELVFMNHPNEYAYDDVDLNNYGKMLMDTNVYRVDYSAIGKIRSNRGYKYKSIISPIINTKAVHDQMDTYVSQTLPDVSGSGILLVDSKPNYVYYDDPNELVDRLRILLGSQQAGHTGHENEINAIIEELKEMEAELSKQLV